MKLMMSLLFVVSFAQVACAQPNYQDVQQLSQDAKPGPSLCPLGFNTEGLCADYAWQTKPTEDAVGSFVLTFWSVGPGGVRFPADPKMNLKVVIWMPDMGHGSSPVTITKQAVGKYLVDGVFFSMHGDWQIRVQMKNAAAVVEEQIATVTF